jgi:hypothetical protein
MNARADAVGWVQGASAPGPGAQLQGWLSVVAVEVPA